MAKPTNFSGAKAYFTTYPEEATLESYVVNNSDSFAVGQVITAEDTGNAWQVYVAYPNGVKEAIKITDQY